MPLVSMKEMLIQGKEHKYAVGQFNINNLESIQAILQAAQEEKSPVILGVTEGAARYMRGFKSTVQMVVALMEEYKITVPVAIHLDRGSSLEKCVQAIHAGFTSVMIDGSHYPLEKNIEITKRVVEIAHSVGVSVEAELGRIGGQEDDRNVEDVEPMHAIPAQCEQLVRETRVDCFAPALGPVHGSKNGKPNLGFHRMKEIMELTGVPLVLHDGSSIPLKDIQKAILFGSAKINTCTERQISAAKAVREILETRPNEYVPHKFLAHAREAIKHTVKGKMREFGSSGRAQLRYEILYR